MAFSLDDLEQVASAPAAPKLSLQPSQPLSNDLVSGLVNFRQKLKAQPVTAQAPAPKPAPGLVTSAQSVTAVPGLDPNIAADMQQRADTALSNEQNVNTQLAENAEKREDDKTTQLQAREDLAVSQQQAEQDRARQIKAASDAEIARLVKEDEEAKVDPDRFVDSMSTGKQIGMVLLAGLSGAFRAASGGSGSGFLDSIEKRIDQDIKAQEEQIRSGRVRRGNQIAAAMSRGANAEQAEALARARAYEAVQNKLTLQANRMGSQGAHADNAAALNAQLETKKADSQNRLQEATQTKYQTSTTYERPRPTGAGTDSILKAIQLDKALEEQGYTKEQRTAALGAVGLAPPKGESAREQKTREDSLKTTEDQAKAEAAWQTIEAYGDAAGITKDPKTGERTADQSFLSMDTLIAPGLKETTNSWIGKGSPIEASRRAAVEGIGRLQSGGVISPSEAENFIQLLGDENATRAQIATNLNALRTLVQSRRSQNNQQKPIGAPASWKSENKQ